jgi:hypothetical protein
MKFNMTAVLASIGLAMCAATSALAEPAADGRGEYITSQVGENQYAVVFRGAPRMSRRSVAEAALRQAAQTTVDQGQEWFFVRTTMSERINAEEVGSLEDLNRSEGTAGNNVGDQIGGGNAGNAATAGVDPGAVGVGTQAPSGLIERRPPRRVYQTVLVIQMGSGDEVTITGMSEAPEIFDAAAILADDE